MVLITRQVSQLRNPALGRRERIGRMWLQRSRAWRVNFAEAPSHIPYTVELEQEYQLLTAVQGLVSRAIFVSVVTMEQIPQRMQCLKRSGLIGEFVRCFDLSVDTFTSLILIDIHPYALLFSFAPIVLFMKVLMSQQGFDKPFTGGLGSYKLYVLVAYHVSPYRDDVELYCFVT